MENIWAFLMQTLTASVAAAVLLIAKRLFLDKLSPRWQYGVWVILALRVLPGCWADPSCRRGGWCWRPPD